VILEIDTGNSSTKWRIRGEGGEIIERGVAPEYKNIALSDEAKELIDKICVSSVADTESIKSWAKWLEQQFTAQVLVACTKKSWSGLTISYDDPSRLGVDRWLAMLSAWKSAQREFVVIDAGTAITIDYVDGAGKHIGGYIVPGLRLQRQALLNETRQIRLDYDTLGDATEWGQNTEEAVNHGVLRMTSTLLSSIHLELASSATTPNIFITGGDGELLSQFIADKARVYRKPDLVLDGLQQAFASEY